MSGWRTKKNQLGWNDSSKKDPMALPLEVRKLFGHALDFAQGGDQHDAAKPLKGLGGAGVQEVVEDDVAGTYRAVFTVIFAEAVFVLYFFQKKSKKGDCHAERGHGHQSPQAASGRSDSKGVATWLNT